MEIPKQLINQLKENFDVDISAFIGAHELNPPVSIRLNPLKPSSDFESVKEVPWCDKAFYLPERPVFTNDPLFHAGCYYVQEASSMFVEETIRQTLDTAKKLVVLDACAAPGGKSTLLASVLSAESLLVSNEVISTRVPSLVHNLVKWGTANTVVTNNDPRDFSRLPDFFDAMVVDAPCSGSGLFRKQHDAIEHWSEESVDHCSLRQQRILADLLPSLKENGILIYSTCSYSIEEDENICDHLCENFSLEPVRLKLKTDWGITETESKKSKAFGYRFFPHLTEGEGFFLACFRKKAGSYQMENVDRQNKRATKTFDKISSEEQKAVKEFIHIDELELIDHAGEIVGWHKEVSSEVRMLLQALKIKKMPLQVGQLKGRDFIPHPYAAYQGLLNKNINKVEVDQEMALKYLRKQPFQLNSSVKGFVLLTYKNFALGWLKDLGNRVNNYYPAEWRILMQT